MNKEIKDEKADKLLEAEMIREAKMIEESLLGDRKDDTPISSEEIDKSYQRFLKRLKAEGMLDEEKENSDAEIRSAEIVRFPGAWEETEKFQRETLEADQDTLPEMEERKEVSILEKDSDIIAEFCDKLLSIESEERKPWYKWGMTAGIALLAAIGILAGSMASQADSTRFVSTVQHIIDNK
ncbi:hypothetical protein ACTQWG_16130 [Blautia sp. HCP3S3_H10_1]|uniref:hypothetical protein n=1 Tax=unclassified Blautia TaxID=2648079 RepID=UPI003F913D4F|nr:hypothetical protein [Clostridia bacterium]